MLQSFHISLSAPEYHIARMFGMVNVWRITELNEIGKIKFGELIDFIHKDAIYKLNFSWLKFGNHGRFAKLSCHQTFPLYGMKFVKLNVNITHTFKHYKRLRKPYKGKYYDHFDVSILMEHSITSSMILSHCIFAIIYVYVYIYIYIYIYIYVTPRFNTWLVLKPASSYIASYTELLTLTLTLTLHRLNRTIKRFFNDARTSRFKMG